MSEETIENVPLLREGENISATPQFNTYFLSLGTKKEISVNIKLFAAKFQCCHLYMIRGNMWTLECLVVFVPSCISLE